MHANMRIYECLCVRVCMFFRQKEVSHLILVKGVSKLLSKFLDF